MASIVGKFSLLIQLLSIMMENEDFCDIEIKEKK